MTACGKFVKSYMVPDRDGLGGEHEVELNTAYACGVEGVGHEGPCAAVESPVTVAARERWLERNRRKQADIQHSKTGLGQFHGRPVTFHEHMGADEPTVHPGMTVPCPMCPEKGIKASDLSAHLRDDHRVPRERIQEVLDEGREERGYLIQGEDVDHVKPRPERADRPGDQPLPTTHAGVYIQDLVIADIEERRQVGIRRYGTALQALNGRDAFRDSYEEVLDLLLYMRQVREERDQMYIHAAALWQWWGATRAAMDIVPADQKTMFPDEVLAHLEALVEWLSPVQSQ